MRLTAVSTLLVLPLFTASVATAADSLTPLRAQLARLGGTTPLRATLERQIANQDDEGSRVEGKVSVTIDANGEGFSIRYGASEIARAEAEARETDPEKPKPVTRALGGIDAVEIAALIDFAPQLLRALEGGRVARESSTTLRGQPARLLEIELQIRMSKKESKHVKDAKAMMKLWLASDGTPLATEVASNYKARFLVLKFEGSEVETRQFVRSGDRLVVTREESRSQGSGLGESYSRHTISTLRL